MTFMELAKKRFSVRAFKSTPVEDEKIAKILEAARIAPTAKNSQPQKIYVLKSEKSMKAINEICECIYGAPMALVIGYEKAKSVSIDKNNGFCLGEIDASIVTTHMMMEATELGLGTCWVGRFRDTELANALGISEDIQLIAIMPVGYPTDDCVPADRHTIYRPDEEVVEFL